MIIKPAAACFVKINTTKLHTTVKFDIEIEKSDKLFRNLKKKTNILLRYGAFYALISQQKREMTENEGREKYGKWHATS